MDDFSIAISFTLEHEGGSDGSPHEDPKDPGGATRFGISQRYHPEIDVLNLTREQAIDIYKREYWLKYGCDQLDFPLSVLFFEACVNPGAAFAQQWRALASDNPGDFLRRRMAHYVDRAGESPYIKSILYGLLKRSVDLGKLVLL